MCPSMDSPPTGALIALDPLVARVLAPNASPFTFTGTLPIWTLSWRYPESTDCQ